ncbi:MAG: hypothetical protein GF332_01150 [Candidatus Moranbacteria bacterium]|nr:hypothetical protein [Candidatus Moranbacteria bacterium]
MPLPYQKSKIKRLISISGEHIVYAYGDQHVIKFPSGPIHLVSSKDALNKVKKEDQLQQKYLKQYQVPYQLCFYKKNGRPTYCVIQKYIQGRAFKIKDLKNPNLKQKLRSLIKANNLMYKQTSYILELFGIKSLFFHFWLRKMENVFVVNQNQLKIIDLGLISDKAKITKSLILRLVIRWAIKRQTQLLKQYL